MPSFLDFLLKSAQNQMTRNDVSIQQKPIWNDIPGSIEQLVTKQVPWNDLPIPIPSPTWNDLSKPLPTPTAPDVPITPKPDWHDVLGKVLSQAILDTAPTLPAGPFHFMAPPIGFNERLSNPTITDTKEGISGIPRDAQAGPALGPEQTTFDPKEAIFKAIISLPVVGSSRRGNATKQQADLYTGQDLADFLHQNIPMPELSQFIDNLVKTGSIQALINGKPTIDPHSLGGSLGSYLDNEKLPSIQRGQKLPITWAQAFFDTIGSGYLKNFHPQNIPFIGSNNNNPATFLHELGHAAEYGFANYTNGNSKALLNVLNINQVLQNMPNFVQSVLQHNGYDLQNQQGEISSTAMEGLGSLLNPGYSSGPNQAEPLQSDIQNLNPSEQQQLKDLTNYIMERIRGMANNGFQIPIHPRLQG